MERKLDYTQFFKDREESTKKLNDALGGRDNRIGFIEPPQFRDHITRVQKGIKELKQKYNIKDIQPQTIV